MLQYNSLVGWEAFFSNVSQITQNFIKFRSFVRIVSPTALHESDERVGEHLRVHGRTITILYDHSHQLVEGGVMEERTASEDLPNANRYRPRK